MEFVSPIMRMRATVHRIVAVAEVAEVAEVAQNVEMKSVSQGKMPLTVHRIV
jgi:hypothetical protein